MSELDVHETRQEANAKTAITENAFHELIAYFPEAFQQQSTTEISDSLRQNKLREEAINSQDISRILELYRLSDVQLDELPDGKIRLPVTSHFDDNSRIPKGYAYKGGAARALLLRSIGKNRTYRPRDIDVIRLADHEPYEGADHDISQRYMADDYEFGHGVEEVGSPEYYLETRDFTINELYADDQVIIATKQCLLDTTRGILRLTEFERNQFDGPGQKMLSKMLRLYSEGIVENMPLIIAERTTGELQKSFISPFWLSVQLDRSLERGYFHAERFIQILKEHHQIPEDITDAEEAAEYLVSLLDDEDFYFRHGPKAQFDVEEQLTSEYFNKYKYLAEKYDKLPTFRGHGKSRGDK